MMSEVWRDIPGHEGLYRVSDLGQVFSIRADRCLKASANPKTRYMYLSLGQGNQRAVHRLVASAFHQNPQNLPEVNHKDGDRQNNRANNLEWSTSSDNKLHSYRELNRKQHAWTQPVILFSGAQELRFDSELAAAKHLGVAAASVRSARNRDHRCRGWNVRLAAAA